ncbi:MAG TPA: fibronectin type III domain-containing protein, partial [Tepidisphaeraceae bacterium]
IWAEPTDGSNLSLEVRGPGDENVKTTPIPAASPTDPTRHVVNGLKSQAQYDFKLRAEKDGEIAYDEAGKRTGKNLPWSIGHAMPTILSVTPSLYQSQQPWYDGVYYDVIYDSTEPEGTLFEALVYPVWDTFNVHRDRTYTFHGTPEADGHYRATIAVLAANGEVDLMFGHGDTVSGPSSLLTDAVRVRVNNPNLPDFPIAELSASPALDANGDPTGEVDLDWEIDSFPGGLYLNFFGVDPAGNITYLDPVSVDASTETSGTSTVPAGTTGTRYFSTTSYSYACGYSNFAADGAAALPIAPTGFKATLKDGTTNQVNVIWDNKPNNEENFKVKLRLTGSNGPWTDAPMVAADVTTTTITLPDATKIYDLCVVAVNAAGPSPESNVVQQSGRILQSVSFGGQSILRDNGNGAYAGAQWLDTNGDGTIDLSQGVNEYSNGTIDNPDAPAGQPVTEQRHPVSYVRSIPGTPSYVSASPTLLYTGAVGAGWALEGDGGAGLKFNTTATPSGGGYVWSTIVSNQELPDTIDSREITITWKLSTGGTAFEIGQSKNWLYVTGAAATDTFETVLQLSGNDQTRGIRPANPGENATTSKEKNLAVINAVWSSFSGRQTKRIGAAASMTYYGDSARNMTRPDTLEELLKTGDGRCEGWAALMQAAIVAQAGNVTRISLVSPQHGYLGTPEAGWVAKARVIRFDPSLRAQGDEDIPFTSRFANHVVIVFGQFNTTGIGGGATIYDPSYGLKSSSKLVFEQTHFGTAPETGFGTRYNVDDYLYTADDRFVVEMDWT